MGTCESFFRNTLSPQKSQKNKTSEHRISPKKNQGSNYFNTPIGSNHISINDLSSSNTSQSYLMFTSSNQNQKPSLLIYQNNSIQNSYLNGSSKLTHDSLSSGKEYIVDGKINNEIDNEQDQGFNHFMAQKEKDINAIIEENNENINSDNNNDKNSNKENNDNNSDKNKNKKDVNIYHHKINNKNRGNKKKTKKNKNLNKIIEQKKEAFPQGLPIPLDSS